MRVEETYSCSLDDPGWLWTHGWVPRDKMRGACLSKAGNIEVMGGTEDDDIEAILKGKVKRGWVITIIGDTSGCGYDMTTYFEETEPVIEEQNGTRVWVGNNVLTYDDEDNESEGPAEVADGPHKATWLQPWSRPVRGVA